MREFKKHTAGNHPAIALRAGLDGMQTMTDGVKQLKPGMERSATLLMAMMVSIALIEKFCLSEGISMETMRSLIDEAKDMLPEPKDDK